MSDQHCKRCGNGPDPDLRTLWMSCLYQMNELDVPFVEKVSEEGDRPFYTLKVCKDCRAEWMGMIEQWFKNVVPKKSPGTGIYLRIRGASVEVTEDELHKARAIADAEDAIEKAQDVIADAEDALNR